MIPTRFELIIYIPTFNRCKKLKDSLDIIAREIVGLEDRVLVYVSNNGSTDGTKEYLQSLEYKWLYVRHNEKNIGVVGNFLHCFDLPIKSEFVWSIGDDDYLMPNSISGILSLIKEYPVADYIFCNTKAFPSQHSAEILKNYFETGKIEGGTLKSNRFTETALVDFEQLIDPGIADTLLGELMVNCFRQSSIQFDMHEAINLNPEIADWENLDFETAGKLFQAHNLPFLSCFSGKTKAVYCHAPRTFNFWGSAEWLGNYDYVFPIAILFLISQYKERGFISDEKFIKLLGYYYSAMRGSLIRQVNGQSTARPFNAMIKAKMFDCLFTYMNSYWDVISKQAVSAPHTQSNGQETTGGSPVLPLTSIIILTHNQLEHTQPCLQSIEEHTFEPYELVIVDNASTDETLDYLRRYQSTHPNVRVIANQENLGFAAGNNQGLTLAQGEFVLLLNNDTIVTPGWLGRMLAVFHRYPQVGLVGPMSNYVSGPQLVKNVAYQNLEEMIQFATAWTTAHAGQSMEFFRIVGFCLLARREVIDRIGGLDERFGSGNFEDDDICLRAALAGFKARITQDVFIHHTGGQTFKAAGIDYRQSLDRNWVLFKGKWNLPTNLPYGGDYRPYLVVSSTNGYIPLPAPANIPLQQRSQTVEGVTLVLLAGEAQPEQTATCLEHLARYKPAEQNIVVKVVKAPASLPPTSLKVVKSSEPSALEALKAALSLPTKYVLLLSADVLVTEKWLDTLLAVAESDPAIAAVGPIANAAPAAQQLEPGYTDLTELPAFAAALTDQYQTEWDEMLYLGGFCVLLKTHTARVVGGLSETLPLPDALLDLYGRMRNFGFKRVCARGVYVHHYQLSAAEGSDYDALADYHQKVNLALTSGQVALAQDDLKTAAYEFARAAEQYPDLAPVHSALGSTLLTLGQTEAAIPSLRRAVELAPQDVNLRRQLGQILYQVGQPAEAEEILKQVQVIQPNDIESRLTLVHLYREQGRYVEAVSEMKQVFTLDPNSTDVLVASGLLLLDLNELAAAELTWSQLKDVPSAHPGVLVLLSALVQSGSTQISLAEILQHVEAIQMANQWPQAMGLLQTILRSSSISFLLPDEQAVLWNRLGYCYFKQDQLVEAEAAFTQGLTLAPNDLDLLNNLTELYLQRAEYDLATEYINRALAVTPQNADTLLLLANVSVQLGVYDVALMAFQQVKALAPNTPGIDDIIKELSNLEGLSLTDINEDEPKVELPDLLEQADTAQAAEDWLQAIAVLQQAVQTASLTPDADEVMLWNRLGSCHYMAGQLPEAEASFLQSLTIDPNSVAALNNLADFYIQEEQYDLATGYLTRALTLAPDDVGVLLSLGHCSIQLGAFDTALLAFQKVKQLAPETAGVEDVLAQLVQLESV